MTKPAPSVEAKGVPVCIAALYCDSAFVGEDKSLTIIRTIDTINFTPETEIKLGSSVELVVPARLVIILKRDSATGQHELQLVGTAPSGETDVLGVLVQAFSADVGPETGYNLVSPVRFVWRGDGLYWMELRTKSNRVIARTSLRLNSAP